VLHISSVLATCLVAWLHVSILDYTSVYSCRISFSGVYRLPREFDTVSRTGIVRLVHFTEAVLPGVYNLIDRKGKHLLSALINLAAVAAAGRLDFRDSVQVFEAFKTFWKWRNGGDLEVGQHAPQSKNVESSVYASDSACIQIPVGLQQLRAHSIQGTFDSHIVSQNAPKYYYSRQ
jgi:hypothetical protein